MTPNRLTAIQTQVVANDASVTISGAGRYVIFTTSASLLTTDTTPGADDVYSLDLQTGTIKLASIGTANAVLGGASGKASVSNDGNIVAFENTQSGGIKNIQVKNMTSGTLTLGSTDAASVVADGSSFGAALSMDGKFLVFTSAATNLVAGDTNAKNDIFLKDLTSGAITRVSTSAADVEANGSSRGGTLSGDASLVVFSSTATNLVAPAPTTEHVYAKHVTGGAVDLVSSTIGGTPGNASSYNASSSVNGRFVAFTSVANNLSDADRDTNADIYLKDLQTGTITLVSADANGKPGGGSSDHATVSADGRFVMFESTANLVPGDGDGKVDLFMKDIYSGSITRLSGVSASGTVNFGGAFASGSFDTVYLNGSAGSAGFDHRDIMHVSLGSGFGSLANATLAGTNGRDTLLAGQGDDILQGKGGNDLLDGGAGFDRAIFQGKVSDYTFAHDGSGLVITDKTGLDGRDVVGNVERLVFADNIVALDIDGIAGQAYRLYRAAFDRTPDAEGLGFWIKAMEGGMGLDTVSSFFLASPEFQQLYGQNLSDPEFITRLYQNVLNREPEFDGATFWMAALHGGLPRAVALRMFSESPENHAALVGIMENGFEYKPYTG